MKPRLFIIAGSDSGGGAGIQADIKTASALGVYSATAITAITVQNTKGVTGVHAIPPEVVAAQINAVLDDIGADAIKTGMLFDAPIIEATVNALKGKNIPLVVDPVMIAKGGASLLDQSAIASLKTKLIPMATLITPNAPEAEALLGRAIHSTEDMKQAAKDLHKLGAKAVLIKGGHLNADPVIDILFDGANFTELSAKRQNTIHTHGTGCTLASAIASYMAKGVGLAEAVKAAHIYVQGALKNAPGIGHGHGPLCHDWMQKN